MQENGNWKWKTQQKGEGKKMMNNLYDKRLQDCGFTKIEETDEIVVYERQQPEFVQVLELGRYENGQHTILSYQKGVNLEGYYNAVSLTLHEALTAAHLMIQKGW